MSEKRNMNGLEKDDILQKEYLRENPYTLPDNYFASVEDAVHKRIHKEETGSNPVLAFFKTSIALACLFGIVFGFGYGAMYLTGTIDQEEETVTYASLEGDSSIDELITKIMGNSPIIETAEEIEAYPNMPDTLSIDKEQIEQYLIDSNISISTLASLE